MLVYQRVSPFFENHHMSDAGDAFRAEAKELLDAMVAIEDKAAEAWFTTR